MALYEETEARKIKENHFLSPAEKEASIISLKSLKDKMYGSNSSLKTVFSCVNCMMGSICLILPLMFGNSGVIPNVVTIIFLALISTKTTNLIITHAAHEEIDLCTLIKRRLGENFLKVYCVVSGSFNFMVCIIYYLFITKMLFLLLRSIIGGDKTAEIQTINFDTFSIQYACLIAGVLSYIIISIKDVSKIVKLGQYGAISIYLYSFFIVFCGFRNMINNENFHIGHIKWMPDEISQVFSLPGTFAFAYCLHNAVIPIMKQNKCQENNIRDISLAHLTVAFLYIIIGMFGTLGLAGKEPIKGASVVMDYFEEGDWAPLFIDSLFLFNCLMSLPLMSHLCQLQTLQIFFNFAEIPNKDKHFFDMFLITVCLLFGIFNVSIGFVIEITGSVAGFFIIYYVPIQIHLSCLYGKQSDKMTELQTEYEESLVYREDCSHGRSYKKIPSKIRKLGYLSILLFGISTMLIDLIILFKGLAN